MASNAAQRMAVRALMLPPEGEGGELMLGALALGFKLDERFSSASLAGEGYLAWPCQATPLALRCGHIAYRGKGKAVDAVALGSEKSANLCAWGPKLLEAGADVNAKSGGSRPLEIALLWRSAESALSLLDLGADPSLRDRHGRDSFQIWARVADASPDWRVGERLARRASAEQLSAMLDELSERARRAWRQSLGSECSGRCELLMRLLPYLPAWRPEGGERKGWPGPLAALAAAARDRDALEQCLAPLAMAPQSERSGAWL